MIDHNVDVGTVFYKDNGIKVSTVSDADNNEHWFILKFPNGEITKYDILLEHYKLKEYWNFRCNILEDAKIKLRQIKLQSIKEKLTQ